MINVVSLLIRLMSVTVSLCFAEAEPWAVRYKRGYSQVLQCLEQLSKQIVPSHFYAVVPCRSVPCHSRVIFLLLWVCVGWMRAGREKSNCFASSTPPLHNPINSVNGISIFPSTKSSVFYKLNTSCVLLGRTLNIRQGWGFLTIDGVLINLIYIKRLGNNEERFMWYYM